MFAQLVGLFGTALFFASYQCKDNRQLFRVQFLSYLCYTAHLFLLGAATGAVSYLINTFRSFCLSSRYDFLRSRAMGAVICVFQILALVFTWSGWLSVLPVAANIATTIGGYTYNARTIRSVGMFINSPLWIAYDIIIGSWAGILDEKPPSSSRFSATAGKASAGRAAVPKSVERRRNDRSLFRVPEKKAGVLWPTTRNTMTSSTIRIMFRAAIRECRCPTARFSSRPSRRSPATPIPSAKRSV